tara:strand:+ start:82 stop:519 length:438 start_codon:yes stop_codon:yes gene_type:complete
MENLKIDGSQWLRDRAEVRRKIARIKRIKINQLKEQMREDGLEKNRGYWKIRRRVIEHNVAEAPTKYTPANADELADRALNLLISSHRPCPPLPCGADDHFMDNQHYNRIEALNMLDAVAVLYNREAHRNAPNIHAFDEQYFGDD